MGAADLRATRMTGPLLVWDGAYGLGPYRVGEVLPAELQPPPDRPRRRSYGGYEVEVADDTTLDLCGAVLVAISTRGEFWVDGENIIGADVDEVAARYFGGVAHRDDPGRWTDVDVGRPGLIIVCADNEIHAVTIERWDLIPDPDPVKIRLDSLIPADGRPPTQRELCLRLGLQPVPAPPSFTAEVGASVRELARPLVGLREPAHDADTGWRVWAGKYEPEQPNTDMPIHELVALRSEVAPLLALPPGWRFALLPGEEAVWEDEDLLVEP